MSNKNSSLGCLSVSDRQMQQFFALKAQGIINHDNFQKFLDNPKRLDSLCTVDYAIATLGKERVITYRKSCKAWKQNVITPKPSLYYSQATIESAAKTNKSGVTDYYLVYCHGFSLLEQSKSYQFNDNWWINIDEAYWATKKFAPGYFLLNMRARFGKTTWSDQEVEITNWQGCQRADGAMVSEALFSIYKILGKQLLRDYFHWTEMRCSAGKFVTLGCFGERGLLVSSQEADRGISPNVQVIMLHKFDSLK